MNKNENDLLSRNINERLQKAKHSPIEKKEESHHFFIPLMIGIAMVLGIVFSMLKMFM